MSVPKDKRHLSSAEYVNTMIALRDHIMFYCVGKKFATGTAEQRQLKAYNIERYDLSLIRSTANAMLRECFYANSLNPEIEEEFWERRKTLKHIRGDLQFFDVLIQKLIDKYVTFDPKTDEVIKAIPKPYFYEQCAKLMLEETNLLIGIIDSDKIRYLKTKEK